LASSILLIIISYRQAPHSRSARLILERQLTSGLDTELAAAYFLNLEQLGLALPPGTLATFMDNTLKRALRTAVEMNQFAAFRPLLDALKSALRSKVQINFYLVKAVLGIQIRIRSIRMSLGLQDPDQLVRGPDLDPAYVPVYR
jgi:hypothetical protein